MKAYIWGWATYNQRRLADRQMRMAVDSGSLRTIMNELLAEQERGCAGVLTFTLWSVGTSHIDGKVHRSGFPVNRGLLMHAFLVPKLLTFRSASAFRSALKRALVFKSIVRMSGDAKMVFTTPATALHPRVFGRIYPYYVAPKMGGAKERDEGKKK